MTAQVIATNPQTVQTFGPGGQAYAANLVGGFMLEAGKKIYEFFGISMNSDNIYSKVLTNLQEAGKIGNSMAFTAKQYGIRLFKIDGTEITSAEMAALIQFIASSRLEFYVGSNKTKVLELMLSHFMNSVTGQESAGNSVVLPINQAAWVTLTGTMIQGLAPNTEISGSVFMNWPTGTAAALGFNDTVPRFAFQFVMAGEKQTK
jgi:hypothetical protein